MPSDAQVRHRALAWYIAGYADGWWSAGGDESGHHPPNAEVVEAADNALGVYDAGACLLCKREGVVLLDGFFCQQCLPMDLAERFGADETETETETANGVDRD